MEEENIYYPFPKTPVSVPPYKYTLYKEGDIIPRDVAILKDFRGNILGYFQITTLSQLEVLKTQYGTQLELPQILPYDTSENSSDLSMQPLEIVEGFQESISIALNDAYVNLGKGDVRVFKSPNYQQLQCLQAKYRTQLIPPLIQTHLDPTNNYKSNLRRK